MGVVFDCCVYGVGGCGVLLVWVRVWFIVLCGVVGLIVGIGLLLCYVGVMYIEVLKNVVV